MKRILAIGIILLFIGMSVPSSSAKPQSLDNVIIVDDEGDGDYTSIKEAVNNSNPGDTIEVYSGTYPEDGIHIVKDNITLLGISYELGEGNDSGKPFIRGNGTGIIIQVEASHVIVSNFTIENPLTEKSTRFFCGIKVEKNYAPYEQHDVTISDCIIRNTLFGIYAIYTNQNLRIIHNHISNCLENGITSTAYSSLSMGFIIAGNVIIDCGDHAGDYGINFLGDHHNVSGNRIRDCRWGGINFGGTDHIIYGNDIENCTTGIRFSGDGNIITRNNFKNYSQIGFWFYKPFLYPSKNSWFGNYWDTWTGIGPKKILGFYVIGWRFPIQIPLLIPWIEFDWHPALKPYEIEV